MSRREQLARSAVGNLYRHKGTGTIRVCTAITADCTWLELDHAQTLSILDLRDHYTRVGSLRLSEDAVRPYSERSYIDSRSVERGYCAALSEAQMAQLRGMEEVAA